MAQTSGEPVKVRIVYKKKRGEHAHHGGAWKVAFADFMTAMMALFLVLWIMAQSQEVKSAVAYYFRHPTDYEGKPDSVLRGNMGLMDAKNGRLDNRPTAVDNESGNLANSGSGMTPESVSGSTASMSAEPGLRPEPVERADQEKDELRDFLKIADLLWKQLGMDPAYMRIKDQVTIESLEDGLLIQLLERADQPLLDEHRRQFSPAIRRVIAVIAQQMSRYPNKLEIEGHGLGIGNDESDKWLGSAALADMARRALEQEGLKANRITRVSGCANARPLNPKNPADGLNRRISILVHPRQWRPNRY